MDVIPPGNGIMHQINLERMSPVIHADKGLAYPDTCVGTDSHTPHVDALGVIAIGVGGLEAENVMLGRASWMRLPEIVGVKLTGKPPAGHHRHRHGAGADRVPAQEQGRRCLPRVPRRRRGQADLGDRATISNMAPEYGATAAMFSIDEQTLAYLRLTGRERRAGQAGRDLCQGPPACGPTT